MSAGGATPRVTLGLPVFNGECFLAESIKALLAQTYTNFELVISDNGSTDRTPEIAQEFADVDPRIRYVRHPNNRGSAFNHNFVVRAARGEFFKWVSDDDLYAPDLVQRCVDALDARPEIVLAHAWTAFINETGTVTNHVVYPLATDVPRPSQRFRSVLYEQGGDDIYGVIRTSVMRRVAPYGSYHMPDRTIVAELCLYGRFHNIPEYLYLRRDHPGRIDRVAPSMRLRSARLDPRRGNRWRHPAVRLVGEYLGAYLLAIWRAPISLPERFRCTGHLLGWLMRHADPLHKRKLLKSADPAIRALGTRSLAFRLSMKWRALNR